MYLGETETEDIVETERSLDYQDQAWRESIYDGASLAATLDGSLSELLTSPIRPIDSDGGGGGSHTQVNDSPLEELIGEPQTPTNFDTAPTTRFGTLSSRAELDFHSNSPLQNEEAPIDEARKEKRTLINRQYAPLVASETPSITSDMIYAQHPHHHHQSNGTRSRASVSGNATAGSTSPAAKSNQKLKLLSDYEANELDRLLAEMSKSLNFDSLDRRLKRDDHHQAAKPTKQISKRNSREYNQNHSPKQQHQMTKTPTDQSHRRAATLASVSPRARNSAISSSDVGARRAERTKDSILGDYDDASRLLEQMIGEQLIESPRVPPRPSVGSRLPREGGTHDNRASAGPGEKKASSSESVASPGVAVASRRSSKQSVIMRQPTTSSPPSRPPQPQCLASRRPIAYTQELVKAAPVINEAAAAATVVVEAAPKWQHHQTAIPLSNNMDKNNTAQGRPDPRDRNSPSRDTPPRPPEVDYPPEFMSEAASSRQHVIEAKPASSPYSSDSEIANHEQERGGGQLAWMKRRTLSSMRSMRTKISDLIAGADEGGGRSSAAEPKSPSGRPSRSRTTGRSMEPLGAQLSSLGQQIRKRFSRSKSRLTKLFTSNKGPRAQSMPNEKQQRSQASPQGHSASQNKKLMPVIKKRASPSVESSSLSGLDLTTMSKSRAISARPTGPSLSRAPSSASIKRLSSFKRSNQLIVDDDAHSSGVGAKPASEESPAASNEGAASLGSGASSRSRRRRKKRGRQRAACPTNNDLSSSSGGAGPADLSALVGARRTTHEYFGQVSPLACSNSSSSSLDLQQEDRPLAGDSPPTKSSLSLNNNQRHQKTSLDSANSRRYHKSNVNEDDMQSKRKRSQSLRSLKSTAQESPPQGPRARLPEASNTFRPASAFCHSAQSGNKHATTSADLFEVAPARPPRRPRSKSMHTKQPEEDGAREEETNAKAKLANNRKSTSRLANLANQIKQTAAYKAIQQQVSPSYSGADRRSRRDAPTRGTSRPANNNNNEADGDHQSLCHWSPVIGVAHYPHSAASGSEGKLLSEL